MGEARERKCGHDRSLSPIFLKEGHLAKPCTRKSIVAWKLRGIIMATSTCDAKPGGENRGPSDGQTCSCSWKACDAIDVISWLSTSATAGSLLRHVPTLDRGCDDTIPRMNFGNFTPTLLVSLTLKCAALERRFHLLGDGTIHPRRTRVKFLAHHCRQYFSLVKGECVDLGSSDVLFLLSSAPARSSGNILSFIPCRDNRFVFPWHPLNPP